MTTAVFDPPFPIDALMTTMRGATEYIHRTNQSPIEMCAASILASSAICAQGLVNITWKKHGSTAPVSNILICAESGERKSENDLIALAEIRKFCKEELAADAEAKRRRQVSIQIWGAKRRTLEKRFTKLLMSGDAGEANQAEEELRAHLDAYPDEQPCAEILLSDVTPAALVKHLVNVCSCIGLVSDEGFPRYLLEEPETLNSLWQSASRPAKRVSREPTDINDTRVSIYIQIQPGVFSRLLKRKPNLYETGFFNRFMLVNAKSSQGTRLSTSDEVQKERIDRYYEVQRAALTQYRGKLMPTAQDVKLSPNALTELAEFNKSVERALKPGSHFSAMRGAASKAAEMCIKLSGILYIMEEMEGDLPVEVVRNAIRITAWFLNQHRLFFHPLSEFEQDMVNVEEFFERQAAKGNYHLNGAWLSRYITPKPIRFVGRLQPAIKALEAQGKVKVYEGSRGSWDVHLVSWDQKSPQNASRPPPPEDSATNSLLMTRFEEKRGHKPPPIPDRPPYNGSELWPGVFLSG